MKHKICLLLIACFYSYASRSQNLFVADYLLYGSGNKSLICYDHSFFRAIVMTTGGQVNAMKTDSAGNVLWSNDITYPNATFFTLTDIVQAADSGLLILLNWRLPASSHSDPTVTKLDKNGNHEWTRTYISVLSAYGYGIIKNNDNGFIVVGSRQLVDYVMKCDATGAIVWIKQFNGNTPASNYDVTTHDYNRFVVTGRNSTRITFFQIDISGNLYWHTAITSANTGFIAWSLKPLNDGGYAATGAINYVTNNDAFLVKADSSGVVQWLKIYSDGTSAMGNDVVGLADSSLILVGSAQSNAFALKTDKNGTYQFAKTETAQAEYSRINLYSPGAVLLSGDLSYPFFALADTSCSSLCNDLPFAIQEYTPAFADTLILFNPVTLPFSDTVAQIIFTAHPLTRNVLCGFTSANEITGQNEINIYPNPVVDKLNISIGTDEPAEIILYDIFSRKLLQQKFTNSTTISTEQLAKGMYLYELKTKNGIVKKGRLIKK